MNSVGFRVSRQDPNFCLCLVNKGRTIKVTAKRVNVAGFNQQQVYEQGGRGGRGGRGFRGGGRGYRGGFRGRAPRGRGRGGYHPYY